MTNSGRPNVRKHREIKNGEKYILLEMYSKLCCLEEREVAYSESMYYMGRSCNGLTTCLDFSTKRSNKKQKAGFAINDINNQYFRKFLKKFNNSLYLG